MCECNDRISDLSRRGQKHLSSGRFDKAEACFRRALALQSPLSAEESSALHFALGYALEVQQRNRESMENYKSALQSGGLETPGVAYLGMARACIREGEAQSGLQFFDQAIACGDLPAVGDAYYAKGEALASIGRFDEALDCYQRVHGHPHTVLDWEIDANCGLVYMHSNDLGLAIEYLTKAVQSELCFQPGHVYNLLGSAYQSRGLVGDLIQAQVCFGRSKEEPELSISASASRRLGDLHTHLGKYVEALIEYQCAERIYERAKFSGYMSPAFADERLTYLKERIEALRCGQIRCFRVNESCPP